MSEPKSRKGIGRPSRVGPEGYFDVLVRFPIEAQEPLQRRAAGKRSGVAGEVRTIVLEKLEEEGE